jgi:hypothetical protein
VQPFRVPINAKGGDCWHVYRDNVLVIDGKFIGRMFLSLMERTTLNQTSRAQKMRNLIRDRSFQKCRRGPRDALARGAKVETHENLENLLIQRD